MKKKNLTDLEKARDHFIRATTESIIGAGFAIKGMRNLLRQREGRKLAADFAVRFIKTGIDLVTNPLRAYKETKPAKPNTRRKKTRKVKIE